jgi:hypothetical protein
MIVKWCVVYPRGSFVKSEFYGSRRSAMREALRLITDDAAMTYTNVTMRVDYADDYGAAQWVGGYRRYGTKVRWLENENYVGVPKRHELRCGGRAI